MSGHPHAAAPAPDGDAHRTHTVERGSFCVAHCHCGWSGPARRSRDRARRDADDHARQNS